MKTNITRECLDQAVFDTNLTEACKFYGITEAQANRILFDKITTKIPERYRWVEPEPDGVEIPDLSPDYNKLKNVVCSKFKTILDTHNGNDAVIIDRRSYSGYDRVMEALTTLLYYNSDFKYVNDVETLKYIYAKLENGISVERVKALRAEQTLPLDEDLDTDEYIDRSEEDARMVMGRLSGKNQAVITHLVGGYSQVEIAEKMGISQQAVSQRLATIRKSI